MSSSTFVAVCKSCLAEMPDPEELLCNGCVQSSAVMCAECVEPVKTVCCQSCKYSVGPCCSIKLHAVAFDAARKARHMNDTVCNGGVCIERWMQQLDELQLEHQQEVYVSVSTVRVMQKIAKNSERRHANEEKRRKVSSKPS